MYIDGPACICPLPSFQNLAAPGFQPFHKVQGWTVPLAPCTALCRHLWLKLPAHGPLAAQSQLAAALSTSVSGQQGAYLWRTAHDIEETPGWGSTSRSAGTQTFQACWPPPSVTQSRCLPSSGPRGMSQLRNAARKKALGWGQKAGGGSWRPCDRWRLCVSRGRAGPPARSGAQSEKASHDCSVGACKSVGGREGRLVSGSGLEIQNTFVNQNLIFIT